MSIYSVFFGIFSSEVILRERLVKMCKNMKLILLVCLFDLVSILECKPFPPEEHPLQYDSADNTTRKRRSPDFVFPEDDDNDDDAASLPLLLPPIHGRPPCAEHSTFCEHFEHYPRAQLKAILKRHALGKELFGVDDAPDEAVLAARDDSQETFVCRAIDATIFPKLAINRADQWRIIINQEEEGYVQGVRIETCKSFGEPCDVISETPSGYVTACKQKYIYRRLLSLSTDGVPVHDTFKLPSACCCSYKRTFNFLDYAKRKSPR